MVRKRRESRGQKHLSRRQSLAESHKKNTGNGLGTQLDSLDTEIKAMRDSLRFIPRGAENPLPALPMQVIVDEADIEKAIKRWRKAMKRTGNEAFADLLDAVVVTPIDESSTKHLEGTEFEHDQSAHGRRGAGETGGYRFARNRPLSLDDRFQLRKAKAKGFLSFYHSLDEQMNEVFAEGLNIVSVYDVGILDTLSEEEKESDKSGNYADWRFADASERGRIKSEIVTNLAKRTGLEKEQVNTLLSAWASSSNDNNMHSLSLQEAASEEFGIQLTDWQKDLIWNRENELLAKRQKAKDTLFVQEYLLLGNMRFETVDDYMAATTYDSIPLATREEERAFLRGMYEHTQSELASWGYKPDDDIVIYRGFGGKGHPENYPEGEYMKYHGNAMESWSIDLGVAETFGDVTLAAKVPIKNILSTARTGFGCLPEGEVVIIGVPSSGAQFIPSGQPELPIFEDIFIGGIETVVPWQPVYIYANKYEPLFEVKHLEGTEFEHDQSTHGGRGRGEGAGYNIGTAGISDSKAKRMISDTKWGGNEFVMRDDNAEAFLLEDSGVYDWFYASQEDRGIFKAEIVEQLSKATGLSEEKVNRVIQLWANSSNGDRRITSLQQAAAEEFGFELTPYQQEWFDIYEKQGEGQIDAAMEKLGMTEGEARHQYPTQIPFADRDTERLFIRSMYENTQARFKKIGLEPDNTIVLYRGFGKKDRLKYKRLREGHFANYQGNVMESWSLSAVEADKFGRFVIAAEIPVRNIVGSARTGFGSFSEGEFVILGAAPFDRVMVIETEESFEEHLEDQFGGMP